MNSSSAPARLYLRALVMLVAAASACSKGGTDPSQSKSINDFLGSATTVGTSPVTATTRSGTPPSPSGGPTASVSSPSQAATGNPNLVFISGSAPFQTIYISIGAAQTADAGRDDLPRSGERLLRLFDAHLAAASIGTSGYLQIDLPAPVTELSVVVNYSSSLQQSTFDLQVQIAAAGGPVGPIASAHKSNTGPGLIEIVGVVYGGKSINQNGPDTYVNPVSGAVISTSLDSRTAVTNASGAFDLVTDTTNAQGRCFRLTVTAAGYPTYSTEGWLGSNKESGGITFSLQTGEPRGPLNGTGC